MSKPTLLRGLGLWSAFSVVAGSTIGSGVFLVASDISRSLPSPFLALSVWVVAAVISLLGGFTFAELGGMYPGAGGQYVYLRRAFGPLCGFLYGWTLFLVIQTGSIAAVSVTFAQFASGIIPLNATALKSVASGVILVLTLINLFGLKKGAEVLGVLTALKLVALVTIAAIGLFVAARPGAGIFQSVTVDGTLGAWGALTPAHYGVALIAAFWAFDGWNNLSFVAGEVINPRRNIPLATVMGILAVAALYIGVNHAFYRVLPVPTIAASSFAAAEFAKTLGGGLAVKLISIAVALSALGCVNGIILSGPRVVYAVADDGAMPVALAYIHPKYRVPSVALLVQMAWAILLVWSGRYDQLFTYVVSGAFLFYGLVGLALIILRIREPDVSRPYRVPLYPWIPLLYFVFTIIFVLSSVVEKPLESLAGLAIVGLGVPAFYLFRGKRLARQYLRPTTHEV